MRGGRKEAAVLYSPGSAHPSCPSPKKAEQDIELWKKQEAAAKEADSGSPGSEQQPEVRVPRICVLVGSSPALGGLSGGKGLNRSWGGRAGCEVKVRVPHLIWGVIVPLKHPVPSPAACPEGQEAADGHDC